VREKVCIPLSNLYNLLIKHSRLKSSLSIPVGKIFTRKPTLAQTLTHTEFLPILTGMRQNRSRSGFTETDSSNTTFTAASRCSA